MKWVQLILEKDINEFELENFEMFKQSEEYSEYKKIVNYDIEKYESLFD